MCVARPVQADAKLDFKKPVPHRISIRGKVSYFFDVKRKIEILFAHFFVYAPPACLLTYD